MSEEEDSDKEGQENEDEENEENENEEGEDEENEEGEDDEDEEGEDEEGEEEEDEEDDKKKKKKGKGKEKEKDKEKKDKDDTTKFEEKKLVPSSEIKIHVGNNTNNLPSFTFDKNYENFGQEANKSIWQILREINNDMDALTKKIDRTISSLPPVYVPPYTPPIPIDTNSLKQSLDEDDIEIKKLINKAAILSDQINKRPKLENKGMQSDDEIEYENKRTDLGYKTYYTDNEGMERNRFPYDPSKYKEYYDNIRNKTTYRNSNHSGGENNDMFNKGYSLRKQNSFNTNRIRKMDELYRGSNILDRPPMVYTQPESKPGLYSNQKDPELNQMNNYHQNKPFERYRPGNIDQAIDILLDKN